MNLNAQDGTGEQTVPAIELMSVLADLNLRLAEAAAQAQQLAQAKDLFLTRVSHELRTPTAAIIGFADTLLLGLHGALTDQQQRHLKTIQRTGEYLLSLINDLVDLSSINSGELELQSQLVSCAEVMAEVAELAAPLAASKGLLLEAPVPKPDLFALADRRAFEQILLNLVGNAVKFTERGRVSLLCQRAAAPEGPRVLCEVQDTGPGVSAEDREKLFQPFHRPGGSPNAASRGSGLGLHLSLELAKRMNGAISVGAAPGGGAVFTLELPLAETNG